MAAQRMLGIPRRARPAGKLMIACLFMMFQRGMACPINKESALLTVGSCRAAGFLLQDAGTLWGSYYATEGTTSNSSSSIYSIAVRSSDDRAAGSNEDVPQEADLVTQELPFGLWSSSGEQQAVPLAATALVPVYSIPGLPTAAATLTLSAPLLNQILQCTLRRWDDEQLMQLNPALADVLPSAPLQVIPPAANSTEDILLRGMMLKEGFNLSNPLPSCVATNGSGLEEEVPTVGHIAWQWLPDAVESGQHVALLSGVCDPLMQDCLSRSADDAHAGTAFDAVQGGSFSSETPMTTPVVMRAEESEEVWPMMGLQLLTVKEVGCGACLWRWFLTSDVAGAMLPSRHFTRLPRAISAAAVAALQGWCGETKVAGGASPASVGFLSLMATAYGSTREANLQIEVQTSEVVNCTDALRDGEHFRVAVCAEGDGGPPDGHLLPPLWLSGTAVVANLPGVEELRLDTDMLGAILSGDATHWSDAGIPGANPGLQGNEAALTLVLPTFDVDGLPFAIDPQRCSDSASSGVTCVGSYREALDAVMRTQHAVALLPLSIPLPSGLLRAELASPGSTFLAPSLVSLEACLVGGGGEEEEEGEGGKEGEGAGQLLDLTAPGCYPFTSVLSLLYRKEPSGSPEQEAAARFVDWLLHGSASAVNASGRRHLCSRSAWLANNPVAAAACGVSSAQAPASSPLVVEDDESDGDTPLSLWLLVGVPCLAVLMLCLVVAAVCIARSRHSRDEDMARVIFADEEKRGGSSMTRQVGQVASRIWESVKEPLVARKSRVTLLEDENGRSDRELTTQEDGGGDGAMSDGGWDSEDGDEHSDLGVDLTAPIVRVIDLLQRIANRVPVRVKEATELVAILEQSDDVHRVPNMRGALDKYNNGDNQIAEYLLSMTDSAGATVSSPQNHSVNRVLSRRRSSVFSMMISGAADIEAGTSATAAGAGLDGRGATDVYDTLENIPCTMMEEGEEELPAPWLTEGVYTEALLKILEPVGQEFFCNLLCLQKVSEERPLTTVTFYLLHRHGIIKDLKLNVERLQCYLMAVEDGYVTENPYHNMYHAADVVQRLVCILRHMGILNTKREGNMRFLTAIIAASVHDFNHPGTNNAFVVRNQGIIAKHYNDQHVIENHSIRMALNMIKDPSMNFLAGSRLGSEEDWIQFRHQVTTLVLATDMSLHFESLSKFQTQMVTKLDKGCARIEVLGNDKGMEMAIQMALKTADIGHCAMRLGSHIYWVAKLEVEFFRQGDLERKAGHPISPLMDREKTGTTHPSNQVGFFDVIVLPLYSAFVQAFPEASPLLDQLDINYSYWKHCAAKPDYAPPSLDDLHWRIMEAFESSGQTLAESNEQFAYLTDMPIDGTGAAARRLGRRHSSESSNSRGRRRSSNGGGKGIRSSLSNTSLSSNASSQHSAATPTPPSESASHVPIPDINRPPVSPVLKPLAQKRHSQPRALPPISCSPTSSFTMREDV